MLPELNHSDKRFRKNENDEQRREEEYLLTDDYYNHLLHFCYCWNHVISTHHFLI